MTPTHTLLILDPGHFHAALVLREAHPRLADEIHVYAESGPDLERFLEMAGSFNRRADRPTRWNLHLHTGPDSLERLIADKHGDVVLIAGRNDRKMTAIERLGRSGFSVLADKPWVIADDTLPLLRAAMEPGRPITLDIMTERFEITTLLQKAFMGVEAVFGSPRIDTDGSPTVFKESVHHLYKIVNERPLVRPSWSFDIQVRDTFLNYLATGACPPETSACNVSRYTLLAEARRLALRSPFAPLAAG